MLYLNSIDLPLFQVLSDLSRLPELSNFFLVGGTALSLQIGHRKSDDLDFFTDRSFDLQEVKNAIFRYNREVVFLNETANLKLISFAAYNSNFDIRIRFQFFSKF
jgi:hypothetical protein